MFQFSYQNASDCQSLPTRRQFLRWARAAQRVPVQMTLRIVDEAEGRMLNRDYRGKDSATNVLSFALTESPCVMGDVVICAPVVLQEAAEQGKTAEAHFAHLTVHGVLHLQGYDHLSEAQAQLMETIETEIVMNLGYANPYLVLEDTPRTRVG